MTWSACGTWPRRLWRRRGSAKAGHALAPGIEWAEIVGRRNRLVPAYFDINTDIPWATARVSLPALMQQLRLIEGVDKPRAP